MTYSIRQRLIFGFSIFGCILWISWLGWMSFSVEVMTDAAYNFLSYKQLFDTGEFLHKYGIIDSVSFNPIVSTGPTVNLIVGLFYSIVSYSQGIYFGTAITNTVFWIIWATTAFFLVLPSSLTLFVPLTGLILILRPINFSGGTVITALGEHYSVILIFVGFFFLSRARLIFQMLGYFFIGLAVLTKVNTLVGLVLPSLFFLLFKAHDQVKQTRAVNMKLFIAHILGLFFVFMPTLTFKFILPEMILNASEVQRYYDTNRAWHNEVGGYASWGVKEIVAYLKTGNSSHFFEVSKNLFEKANELQAFYGGEKAAFLVLFLMILMLFLLFQERHDLRCKVMFYYLLFGVSVGFWWFFSNKATWYRYIFMCDLVLQMCFCFTFVLIFSRFFKKISLGSCYYRRDLVLSVLLLCSLIYLSAQQPPFDYSNYFRSRAQSKKLDQQVAKFAEGLDGSPLFFGYGWIQSAQIRVLGNFQYFNILRKEDVLEAVGSERPLYMIYDPVYEAVGFSLSKLEAIAESETLSEGHYKIYKLNRVKVHEIYGSLP